MNRRPRTRSLLVAAGLGSVLAACAGDAPTAPIVDPPTQEPLLLNRSDERRAEFAALLGDARGRLLPALEGREAEVVRSALDQLAASIGTRQVESSIEADGAARAALLAIRAIRSEGNGVRPWSADLDALLLTLEALHGTLVSAAPLVQLTSMEEG
jgi:hypothetical protein